MPGIFKNRTLRIVLVCLACLFAALMLVMQVALNRHVLTRIVNSVAERFVDGDVSFGRVKADVFKSFPNLSVSVDDFTLTYPHGKFAAYDQAGIQSPLREEGRGSRTDTLASLKQLRVSLNYLDALSGRWHVRHAFLTAPRIFGLTARMYAIVRNVVRPAITSVFTFVPCSLRWNSFSI